MTSTAVSPVTATELAGNVNHDLSLIGLFMNADPIVMLIMTMLILMSVISWAIIIDKQLTFKTLDFKTGKFEHDFWSAESLDSFYTRVTKKNLNHPIAAMFRTAIEELKKSQKGTRRTGTASDDVISAEALHRIQQMMHVTRNRELDKVEKGLGFLGSAGSSAPFIGLFGTVIGIMNSFTSIAGSNNTSLAVVAPGIAEALFATAIGLFVAIPAVLAYNKFSQSLGRYTGRLDDFSVEFIALLTRQGRS
jgi:biopolymer transport protein TolQ